VGDLFSFSDLNAIKVSMRKLLDQGGQQFYNAHGVVCDENAIIRLLEKEDNK